MSVEDKNSAVETVSREKATNEPGSVGAPMSGVVVEVRVKEGQEIKKGDPVCGTSTCSLTHCQPLTLPSLFSPQRHEGMFLSSTARKIEFDDCSRWNPLSQHLFPVMSSASSCTKVRIKLSHSHRLSVFIKLAGDSINQGDLTVEIVH